MTIAYSAADFPQNGLLNKVGAMPVWQLFGTLTLFATATFNLVAFNVDKDTVALDSQVIIKLLLIVAAGVYGGLGFMTDSRIRKMAFSLPAFCLLCIIGIYFLASVVALEPKTSLVSTVSILAIFLMTLTAMVHLGRETTVQTVFWSTATFVTLSWIAYLFLPGLGMHAEPIGNEQFQERMAGLAHPNTLGQHAAFCCCLGLVLYFSYQQKSALVIFMVLLAMGALICSLSRSAMLASVIALLIGFRHEIYSRSWTLRWFAIFLVLSLLAMMFLSTRLNFLHLLDEKLLLLTKSGDAEELFTATGRGEIWSETIRLIGYRPVLGYGPTSSKLLLEDYSLYTHNLVLNVGLSAGVGALGLAIAMCLGRVRMLFSRANPVADTLAVFILIVGIFENVIFANICGLPTICWIIGIAWFQTEDLETEAEVAYE